MKSYAKITDPKDIVTKEYTDNKYNTLDKDKINEADLVEFSNSEILAMWQQYIED